MSSSSSSMSHPQARSDHPKCSLFSRAKNAQGHVFYIVEATETKARFLGSWGLCGMQTICRLPGSLVFLFACSQLRSYIAISLICCSSASAYVHRPHWHVTIMGNFTAPAHQAVRMCRFSIAVSCSRQQLLYIPFNSLAQTTRSCRYWLTTHIHT